MTRDVYSLDLTAFESEKSTPPMPISCQEMPTSGQDLLDQTLAIRAAEGALSLITELLAEGANPLQHDSRALQEVSENGHVECVKLLIPISNPQASESYALQLAAKNGHAECLKLLIPLSDARADNSLALRWAADGGHAECLRLLIPVSDPKAKDSLALRLAAGEGHVECVKLLIPFSEKSPARLRALRAAVSSGRTGAAAAILEGYSSLGLDVLVELRLESSERGNHDLAAIILSSIERQAFSEVLSIAPSGSKARL